MFAIIYTVRNIFSEHKEFSTKKTKKGEEKADKIILINVNH
jgi:hypothetical protein